MGVRLSLRGNLRTRAAPAITRTATATRRTNDAFPHPACSRKSPAAKSPRDAPRCPQVGWDAKGVPPRPRRHKRTGGPPMASHPRASSKSQRGRMRERSATHHGASEHSGNRTGRAGRSTVLRSAVFSMRALRLRILRLALYNP